MNQPTLIQRQIAFLDDVRSLVGRQVSAASQTEAGLAADRAAAQQEFDHDRQTVQSRYESETQTAEREVQQARAQIAERYQTDFDANETELELTQHRANSEREAGEADATGIRNEARFETAAVYEAAKTEIKARFQQIERRVTGTSESVESLRAEGVRLLKHYRQSVRISAPSQPSAEPAKEALGQALAESIRTAEQYLAQLRDLSLPKLLRATPLTALVVLLWLPSAALSGWLLEWQLRWLPVSVVATGVLGGVLVLLLKSLARSQVAALYGPLRQALATAEAARKRWQSLAVKNYRRERSEIKARKKAENAKTDQAWRQRMAELAHAAVKASREAEVHYQRRRIEITERRDVDRRLAESRFASRTAEVRAQFDRAWRTVHERHEQRMLELEQALGDFRREREQDWHQGLLRVTTEARSIELASDRLFPGWSDRVWKDWAPPTAAPPVMRIGQWQVGPEQLAGEAAGRISELPSFLLPALVAFPEQGSLLVKATGPAREQAVGAIQATMLRLLTSVPPGKVRFTILDPVGLGQNFAAFMHLADYEEALVGGRIWTEPAHIEERLADLTEQMEIIIQKYLRNEFPTIQAYNDEAGEVAEPFRILVVANFPANFSEAAARRLVSIATSGARCGVYTLVSVDTAQALPPGLKLADLEQHSQVLRWDGRQFVWHDAGFGELPFSLDSPPPDEAFTSIVKLVGRHAQHASRVEVPFSVIAPSADQWWTGDSRSGIHVPLGPAGATKRQYLKLGQGTAQHALVAGKTGSGKSTLLHALITNLALVYSPDEIELYLVDFKKGVEFKTYVAHQLPHARVVAIESDREFGLSVLERLDAELKSRGERFRALGVQDLAAYRRARHGEPLPRILLVVDEFQEFFVEDDKLAQEVGLLLDRLVRQGRAFGIHVLLGSQTLGGAYSLARSTIGQMAVRIALQCSETDAHLILGEDNSAARLLSRPGEAIYNDGGGLVEANHPFQVAWLPDHEREQYLRQIQLRAGQFNGARPPAQIVFEGNLPADVGRNALLDELLEAQTWPAGQPAARVWLGEPVAIKEPTAAVLRRQSGNHLLVIGQDHEAAAGILATAVVGLAAQHAPATSQDPAGGARFYVLDGSPSDSRHCGLLAQAAGALPHAAQVGGFRDAARLVAEVADEVERRLQSGQSDAAPWYLLLYDLQRFRDLRKSDDDFGFSRMGAEQGPSPASRLLTILRDGAVVGVHVLAWCDSWNNLQRTFDRQGLREFELRVLFQMSAGDSSNLIDTPLASRLGVHRALFYSEEQGTLEKFRPYAVPSLDWLTSAADRLRSRTAASPQASSQLTS